MTKKNTTDGFLSRTVDFTFEERADGENTGRKLSGYAAVFNQDTPIRSWEGTFDERIAPGAFTKTLAERKPVMQFDHGRDSRFGSLPIGNFTTLREDPQGLYVEGDLFDHAAPIAEAIRSGAVSGMSFKFGVVRDQWHDANGKEINSKRELQDLLWGDGKDMNGEQRGPLKRTIKEVRMIEAGPVVFPAYPQTTVGVRSLDDDEREALMDVYERAMKKATPKADPDGDNDDDSKEPYGDVEYADPGYQKDGKKRYPVDTKEHAQAALSYINKGSDAAKYTPDQLSKVKAAIVAACKKFGINVDESKSTSEPDEARTSEDVTSVATDADARDESPDDAAQAGTSTGMSSNARERFMALNEI